VRERAMDEVLSVEYEGAAGGASAPGVSEAIAGADLVVVCTSNPVTPFRRPDTGRARHRRALGSRRRPWSASARIIGGAPSSGQAAA